MIFHTLIDKCFYIYVRLWKRACTEWPTFGRIHLTQFWQCKTVDLGPKIKLSLCLSQMSDKTLVLDILLSQRSGLFYTLPRKFQINLIQTNCLLCFDLDSRGQANLLDNVWCNKNRTKHSSILLLPLVRFSLHQTLVSAIQEGESDQTVTKCWQHQHTLQLCDILFTKSTISKHDRITGMAEPLGTLGIYPKQFLSILAIYIALFLEIFYSLMGSRELFFLETVCPNQICMASSTPITSISLTIACPHLQNSNKTDFWQNLTIFNLLCTCHSKSSQEKASSDNLYYGNLNSI